MFAGLLALIAAPLHAFALPRNRADPTVSPTVGLACRLWCCNRRAGPSPGGSGVRSLCVRSLGAVRASARDLRPSRDRRCHRGYDRRPVRTRAGSGAHRRARARPPHPSPQRRTLRGGTLLLAFALLATSGLIAAAAAFSILFGMRTPHHHRSRSGSARAVRRRGLRSPHGTDRRAVPGDAGHRATRARVRHRAQLRPDRACRSRDIRADLVHRAHCRAEAIDERCVANGRITITRRALLKRNHNG